MKLLINCGKIILKLFDDFQKNLKQYFWGKFLRVGKKIDKILLKKLEKIISKKFKKIVWKKTRKVF